jgi:predicted AlkP superfamily phosphohydrolase/phosphomutase
MRMTIRYRGVAVLALGVLLIAIGACDRKADFPGPHKLVVIGFDAADWGEIDPLIEAGRLPVMKRYLDQSTSGTNMSFTPLEKSPLIWASMATGLRPDQHGIGGFTRSIDAELSTARDWRAPAFWHLAGEMDMTACVLGWWVTYPASAINGVLVSDACSYTTEGFRDPAGLVRPDELSDELMDLVVDYRDITLAELGRFIDLEQLAGHEEELAYQLDELRVIIAGDRSYLEMARHLAATTDYDVFSVYFRGLDLTCHRFWEYHHPEVGPGVKDETARAVFASVVPAYYEYCDEILGEMLALFPADRPVMILSDHGFHGSRQRRGSWVGGVQAHRPQGVYAVRSPIHEPGVRFDRTGIINVGPTILALMGLPPSADMPGVVITDGMTPAGLRYAEKLEGNRVPSYASFAPATDDSVMVEQDAEMDEAIKRQLKSLGYID